MTAQIPPAQRLPTRDRSVFLAHFEAMSCSAMRTNCDETPPMLRSLPRIPQEVADCLHIPPSAEEVKAALKSMKRGTAPGPDGFPVEFYLTFWDEIGATFTAVIRRCYEDGVFPSSFRDGRIVLIPKSDASSVNPEDWRPITLLNVDYKIFAAVAVQRLRGLLNTLVGHHQTSSVLKR
uniref:Putative tick transposon n=1 Tax=Rhipicephalus microplus TaxID=6941 RepID=A0A6G5ABX0_RHIMP